jgi:hypothetical protein
MARKREMTDEELQRFVRDIFVREIHIERQYSGMPTGITYCRMDRSYFSVESVVSPTEFATTSRPGAYCALCLSAALAALKKKLCACGVVEASATQDRRDHFIFETHWYDVAPLGSRATSGETASTEALN